MKTYENLLQFLYTYLNTHSKIFVLLSWSFLLFSENLVETSQIHDNVSHSHIKKVHKPGSTKIVKVIKITNGKRSAYTYYKQSIFQPELCSQCKKLF